MVSIENATVLKASGLTVDRLENINNRLQNLPEVLDKTTLQQLVDGAFDISLEEYTDLSTYKTTMSALYGNRSASTLPDMLNTLLGNEKHASSPSAKDFIDKMRERGISNGSALKLYTALKTYSINSSLITNNSFVSAKI